MAANQNLPQSMGSTNTVFNIEPRFDPSYVRTLPGIVKVGLVLLNLLGLICIQSSAFRSNGRGVYFSVVSGVGLCLSGGSLALYLCHVVERYHRMPWLRGELLAAAVLAFLYLVASTIVVAFGSAAYSAAGFFGYLAMVLYGFEAFLRARAQDAGEPAQGARVPVPAKQPHVVTPPALP